MLDNIKTRNKVLWYVVRVTTLLKDSSIKISFLLKYFASPETKGNEARYHFMQ